jgi:predicted Zn finger-like uncharacterized protein
MIVICTRCQARFRVSDDKVGPRGARVRCARCQTLFAIGPPSGDETLAFASPRDAPPARPAPEVELEAPAHGEPTELGADDPFAGFRLDAGPPFDPPGAEPSMMGDPFGAARDDLDPLGGGVDPFAAGGTAQVAALEEPAHPDPHWGDAPFVDGTAASGAGDPGAISPGADLAWADDPFSAAISPRAARVSLEERRLPVTDLADLLGDDPRPPAVPPPLPPPRDARGFPAGPEGGRLGPDLALEERTTPPPAPLRTRGDLLADLPLLPREDDLDAGPTELGAPAAAEEEPLALATEPVRGLPEMWRTSPAFPPAPEEVVPPEPARSADVGSSPEAKTEAAARVRAARRGALRSIAINAVSLAALLGVALAFRVLWRGEGTAAAWSPSALLRAVRPGERTAASLETAGVTSGRYPRAAGAPLLFVRGEVISRAPAPLARVRVDVEVVRAGRVLAHRSGLAGAVPTAEELHAVKDAAALDALASAISGRARDVRPGAPVPFLVPFAEVPEDLTGASVRVVASPAR